MSRVGAVLVAAGSSTRVGGAIPKQFQLVGVRPLFIVSMGVLLDDVEEIAVVVPAAHRELAESQLRAAGLLPGDGSPVVRVVEGGARRQDSVRAGLDALSSGVGLVLVHDAARPFATRELVRRVLEAAGETGAAVPAVPVPDTVKHEDDGAVVATLDRSVLRLVQTPQGFRRPVIERAYRALGDLDVTDDAGAVELAGGAVALVEGSPSNRKVTTAEDLDEARVLLTAGSGLGDARVGFGADWHELVAGRRLVLGGVEVPFEKGLAGHSDADALTHAVCDAVLGAAAAGDIGRHFPPGDARWKDASSIGLLERVVDIVAQAGLIPTAVDAVIVAERPKLAPFIPEMRKMLAEAMGLSVGDVSVKATTTEGLGPEGEGRAMSATAVAVLRPALTGCDDECACADVDGCGCAEDDCRCGGEGDDNRGCGGEGGCCG